MSPPRTFGDTSTRTEKTPCCFENKGQVKRTMYLRLRVNKLFYTYTLEFALVKDENKKVQCFEILPSLGDLQEGVGPECPDKEMDVETQCTNSFNVSGQTLAPHLDITDVIRVPYQLPNEHEAGEWYIDLKFDWTRWFDSLDLTGMSSFGSLDRAPGKLCCECEPDCAKAPMKPWELSVLKHPPAGEDYPDGSQKKCANVGKYEVVRCKTRGGVLGGGSIGGTGTGPAALDELIDGLVPPTVPGGPGYVAGDAWTELIEDHTSQIMELLKCSRIDPKTCKCDKNDSGEFQLAFCVKDMYPTTSEVFNSWINTMKPEYQGVACRELP